MANGGSINSATPEKIRPSQKEKEHNWLVPLVVMLPSHLVCFGARR
jgi:hypothetical protein